ncbi:nipped-B-like protein B isoform X2 [Pecten maximus]|uniref:nipped-B-like protein B isoform X2 n=1 Tax=Pecten maximus TaxID=6579 RepID=UPI00145914AC|nr:nipped-B-like protein B isoform X2 [Pecten maximus]
MGTYLCSIACLLIQRTVVEALLYESTNLSNNMPGKRRSKKKEVDEDENCSQDDGMALSRRSLSKRQRKIVSYSEDSPKTTKAPKVTKKNILKDSNDNEIPQEHSKLSKKSKLKSEKTKLTDIKVVPIKTEAKETKVRKTKGTIGRGKKKYNQIGDEKKLLGGACDGVCNGAAANSIDKSAKDVQSEDVSVTCGQGQDSISQSQDVSVTCGQGQDSISQSHDASVTCGQGQDSISQSQDATFTVGSPSAQDDPDLHFEDKHPSCATSEATLDTNTTEPKEDTAKTYVKQRETQNTSFSGEAKQRDTQNTSFSEEAKQRDTQNTSVSQEDKPRETQNTSFSEEDKPRDTQNTSFSEEAKQRETQNTSFSEEAKQRDTQNTSFSEEDKQRDTQNTSFSEEDKQRETQNTSFSEEDKPRDTQNTSVLQEDKQNAKVIQENTDNKVTQAKTLSRRDSLTKNRVLMDNVDTMAEKVAQKLASQQNEHLRPILDRMDDIMKAIRPDRSRVEGESTDVSLPSTECFDSAVQTMFVPHVDVHVQTTEKYQMDTSQSELISAQNERDILWEKCQSQTKVIRDLQNDLYKTRNEFNKDKLTYQVALVSVLTTPSDASQYSRIVTRLSREDLNLDELCKLVLETRTCHPRDPLLPTCPQQEIDDTPLTKHQEPAKLAEVKLEPQSPR